MVGERSAPPPAITGYTPIQRISSGGYGDVHLYDEPRLNRKVAIKVIRDPLADPHVRQRFETEAHTMAKLEHPHVVRIYGTGTTDAGQPFISMMFCPNATMAERCVREHLSVDEVLRIGIAMSGALESAHRAGILHRDVKPANILTTPWDEPGLSDFGVAANAAAADDGDIGVSIPWSPPEMLLGRAKGSPVTDVYSLGATVWTLLVGRSPFEIPRGDNSRMALIGRISNAPVPRTGRNDVPPVLEQILARSMAKDPAARFRSAADFGRALQSVEIRLQRPVSNMVVLGAGTATEARSWPREEALWLSNDDDPPGAAWPSRPYPLATETAGGLSPSGPGGQASSGQGVGAAAFGGQAADGAFVPPSATGWAPGVSAGGAPNGNAPWTTGPVGASGLPATSWSPIPSGPTTGGATSWSAAASGQPGGLAPGWSSGPDTYTANTVLRSPVGGASPSVTTSPPKRSGNHERWVIGGLVAACLAVAIPLAWVIVGHKKAPDNPSQAGGQISTSQGATTGIAGSTTSAAAESGTPTSSSSHQPTSTGTSSGSQPSSTPTQKASRPPSRSTTSARPSPSTSRPASSSTPSPTTATTAPPPPTPPIPVNALPPALSVGSGWTYASSPSTEPVQISTVFDHDCNQKYVPTGSLSNTLVDPNGRHTEIRISRLPAGQSSSAMADMAVIIANCHWTRAGDGQPQSAFVTPWDGHDQGYLIERTNTKTASGVPWAYVPGLVMQVVGDYVIMVESSYPTVEEALSVAEQVSDLVADNVRANG
ncbi:MAG TPA: protein kinase [Tetrasphaera sp.]|uniref:protein kinase domain-containing protein n=1 Tax=Nostocoides sp. TaxID=1917966 RepID=UPI002C0D11E5|nr:protein kinase [Tetrasphaera sp.]HNQ06865.1 protein kinase [Tetrasphaera sp.]